MDKKLPGEYKLILFCSRQNLKEEDAKEILSILSCPLDWNKIVTLSQKNEILPLIYKNLKQLNTFSSIPDTARKILEDAYYITLKRNLHFLREIAQLIEKFESSRVKAMLLKGIALIETVYKNPGLRAMADTDILVPEDKIAQTRQLLKQSGYQEITKPLSERYIEKYQITFGFSKEIGPGICSYLDIHKKLIPDRPYPLKLSHIWERTQSISIEGRPALTLSAEDTFLFLCLHLRGHLRQFLLLKCLCDIAELLNRYADTLDWDYIAETAKTNRIRNNLYFALFACNEILDMPIPKGAPERLKPAFVVRKLMTLYLDKNSFFALTTLRRFILRFLFFDRLIDVLGYFFSVCLLERRIDRARFGKTAPK